MTDAMFPGGSPALVEPIYSDPLLSGPFNEQLAAALRAYVLAQLEACGPSFFIVLCVYCFFIRNGKVTCGLQDNDELVGYLHTCNVQHLSSYR